MADRSLMTFWGKLRKDKTLVTSEGNIKNVLCEKDIPTDNYGFFFVEKRGRRHIILKFFSETKIKSWLENG